MNEKSQLIQLFSNSFIMEFFVNMLTSDVAKSRDIQETTTVRLKQIWISIFNWAPFHLSDCCRLATQSSTNHVTNQAHYVE
jgi:hypothetical protein